MASKHVKAKHSFFINYNRMVEKMFVLPYALTSILRRKQNNIIEAFAIALAVALFIGAQAGSS